MCLATGGSNVDLNCPVTIRCSSVNATNRLVYAFNSKSTLVDKCFSDYSVQYKLETILMGQLINVPDKAK